MNILDGSSAEEKMFKDINSFGFMCHKAQIVFKAYGYKAFIQLN